MSARKVGKPDELPEACTLGPSDGPERMRRWRRLVSSAHAGSTLDGRMLEVRFEPNDGVRAELAELVAAERVCCSFVNWTVDDGEAGPILRVLARPDHGDDLASVASLFATG